MVKNAMCAKYPLGNSIRHLDEQKAAVQVHVTTCLDLSPLLLAGRRDGHRRRIAEMPTTARSAMRRPRLSSSSSSEDEDATSSDQYPLFTCIVDHFAWICCSTPGDLNEAPATAAAVLCSFALFLAMCFFLVSLAAASDHKNLIIRQEAKELGPPRHAFTHPPQFVDVVYTWVNGSHPEVEKTLIAAMASKTLPYRPHASRFRDDGLFQYAIRSLLAADGLTASVRHIYICHLGRDPDVVATLWRAEANRSRWHNR